MNVPKCGVCFDKATQRLLGKTRVMHRCKKHAVSARDAKVDGYQRFDITSEGSKR